MKIILKQKELLRKVIIYLHQKKYEIDVNALKKMLEEQTLEYDRKYR